MTRRATSTTMGIDPLRDLLSSPDDRNRRDVTPSQPVTEQMPHQTAETQPPTENSPAESPAPSPLSQSSAIPQPSLTVQREETTDKAVRSPLKGRNARFATYIDSELQNRIRNIAYHVHPRRSLSDLTEEGLREVAEKYERINGGAFPQRPEELRPGRPIR